MSVVIPFYNELDLIAEAIRSVLELNLGPSWRFEVIIVNDGEYKEEKIYDQLKDFHASDLKVYRNTNQPGAGGARNLGIEKSHGSVIAFLDADDKWLPGKILRQLKYVNEGASFVCCNYKEEPSGYITRQSKSLSGPFAIACNSRIGTSTVMVTRELVGDYRFSNLKKCQDLAFWITLSKAEIFRYAVVPEVLAQYCPSGRTQNKWDQLKYAKKALEVNDFSFFEKSVALGSIMYKTIIRQYKIKLSSLTKHQ